MHYGVLHPIDGIPVANVARSLKSDLRYSKLFLLLQQFGPVAPESTTVDTSDGPRRLEQIGVVSHSCVLTRYPILMSSLDSLRTSPGE